MNIGKNEKNLVGKPTTKREKINTFQNYYQQYLIENQTITHTTTAFDKL